MVGKTKPRAAKQAAIKKPAIRKTAAKKTAAKKAAAKKAAAKKVAVKKVSAKKAAAKKVAAKRTAATKPAAKKAAARKATVKKATKAATKRTAKVGTPAPRKAAAKSLDTASASQRIDERIAGLRDWRGERLAEIRKLIHEVDPEVVEEWKWMGTPVWSHQGMYVLANPHKDKVKLTFFHGAKLADPQKLFNAGLNGGKWRAIDLREGDRIDKSALKSLLREAVAYNATHAVPKSKGSRT